ncbi:hypothetical protein GCM10007962_23330 [Yeosuana aromativorans]|uniref:Uncharacterized protein n=1 Tax=Yeosuana aromativorans TaxID=288019 RepID=A0A8J3FHC4_9FLAO|nr:hypothetical protein [Yeosuana aromativorans]GGK28393.1 hypothetical protein GCM10007962_23330 [Yeosuana aromativorans]
MKVKKTFKIITGFIVFLTLPSILFFVFMFFKYNDDLPTGEQGQQADALAYNMLDALNYDAYKNTNYLEWTFKRKHHYKWKKNESLCSVYWEDYKVDLNLNDKALSKAYVHGFNIESDMGKDLIKKAISYFNNDSFWLVAPYKVFDYGTERRYVTQYNGDPALLVTYTKGGSTPGDSYLWLFDESGKPKSFKMWVSILPLKGLESSWSNWTTTESGAMLPTFHNIFFLGIEITNIKGTY